MARNDWCALIAEPTYEYVAVNELRRFGLSPFLPELNKRWIAPRGGGVLPRRFPLFPCYILLRIAEANHRAVHYARGLRKFRPVLADDASWRSRGRSGVNNAAARR